MVFLKCFIILLNSLQQYVDCTIAPGNSFLIKYFLFYSNGR